MALLLFGILGIALPLCAGILTLTPENSFVETLAGTGHPGSRDGHREASRFQWPTGVAVDHHGNIYVADFNNNQIRKVSLSGIVTTFAGSGVAGHADGVGKEAMFYGPDTVVVDARDNLFVADADNFRIRKITPDGMVATIAGNGHPAYRDGEGRKAQFVHPTGIAVDRHGNLFVADRGSHTIRKITPDGMVATVAGNGTRGSRDGPLSEARLNDPVTLVLDLRGNLYVADAGNHSIRKITPEGQVTTLAGGGLPGYKDGRGTEARFNWPSGIALDSEGNLYVSDSKNSRIRKISPEGAVTTLAGAAVPGYNDGPGNIARFRFPTGLGVDQDGTVYVADSANHRIRTITAGHREFAHAGPGDHDDHG